MNLPDTLGRSQPGPMSGLTAVGFHLFRTALALLSGTVVISEPALTLVKTGSKNGARS